MSVREENVRIRISTESDLDKTSEQLNQLIKLQGQLEEQVRQSALSARTNSVQQVNAIEGVTAALKEQQTAQKKAGEESEASTKKAKSGFEDLNKGVRDFASLVGTAFAIHEVKQFGLDVIETKTKIDSLKISLDVMLGSKKESAAIYADIVKLAKETPFTLEEVAEQAVKLKAYNIATADIIPTITALGNISAAVGKEKLPQLTLAYGQVANAGKLMLTELRQFNEAGVPLIQLIADAYGKTREEVQKLADNHEISFAMVRKALLAASEDGGKYANLMTLVSKTVGGEVGKLSDTFVQAKARIGDFFENTIQSGTRTLDGLMEATLGSNSAIQRTVDIVKAAGVAFVTYQVATRAAAATSAILMTAEAAKNVIYGTYLITLQAVTGQQTALTTSQVAATTAARGLWAALATNPLGAIAAAFGLLVTAYYAFKAANEEVTTLVGEQVLKLKEEQVNLNVVAKAAMNAAEGTKVRKDAIQQLIKEFPEYFSGLDVEKTSNSQLKAILDKVNDSYAKRIDLQRETYKAEGIKEARDKLFQDEQDFFNKIGNKQIEIAFGGSVQKFSEALKAGGKTAEDLRETLDDIQSNGATKFEVLARRINNEFVKLERETTESNKRTTKANEETQAAQIEATKVHYATLVAQAGNNSKEVKRLKEEELVAISKANGTYREKELTETVSHEEKVKQVTLLSAKQISVLKKEQQQDSLTDQLKLLDAEMNAEIEAANKATVSRKISAGQLVSLREDAEKKIIAIIQKYQGEKERLEIADRDNFSRSIDETIRIMTDGTDKLNMIGLGREESDRERIKRTVQFEKDASKLKGEILENDAKLADTARLSDLLLVADTAQKKRDLLVEIGKKTGDDLAVQELLRIQQHRDTASAELALIKATNGEQSAEYQKKYIEFLTADKEYGDKSITTQKQLQGQLIQIYAEEAGRKKELQDQLLSSLLEGLQLMERNVTSLRDASLAGFKSVMDSELALVGDNYAKRQAIIQEYYNKETETLYSTQSFTRITGFLTSALTAYQAYTDQKNTIDQNYSLKIQEINTKMNLAIATGQDEVTAKKQAADATQVASEAQKQQTIAAGISAGAQFLGGILTQTLDLQIQNANAQIQIETDKYNAQIKLLDDRFAHEKAANDQATADALTASETRYKNSQSTLEKDLSDTLTKISSAHDEERRRISGFYAEKIKKAGDNKAEVEALNNAMNAELKAADEIFNQDTLKAKNDNELAKKTLTQNYTNEQTSIKEKGKNEQVRLERELAAAKGQAEADYQNKARKLQSDAFEAQRSMAKAQIAMSLVAGAAQLFAINPILGIIGAFAAVGGGAYLFSELNSIVNPYTGGVGSGGGLGQINGQNIIGYDSAGQPFTGLDKDGNPIYSDGSIGGDNKDALGRSVQGYKQITYTDFLGNQKTENRAFYGYYSPFGDGNFTEDFGENLSTKEDRRVRIEYSIIPYLKQMIAQLKAAGLDATTEENDLKAWESRLASGNYFKGTDFLERNGAPMGIDTININANEGERILPTADNLKIGGRGLSNADLVEKVLEYDKLMDAMPKQSMFEGFAAAYPSIYDPGRWSDITSATVSLPRDIANAPSEASMAMLQMGDMLRESRNLRAEMKGVRDDLAKQKWLEVNFDKAGFTTSIMSAMAKQTHIDNLLGYKR